ALAERFQDPRRLVHAGACAGYLGEETAEHELFGRAAARARASGAVGTLPYVLEHLAGSEAVDGRYAASAAAHATEGLLSAGEVAERHFTEALRRHGESARPFDRARTELVFGEYLRREGRRTDARVHLRSALDGFERLGAAAWAERARGELRASGETA